MFVFRESATTLAGSTLYNLQCAEGDGNYLAFSNATGKENSFSTTPKNYLFLNDKSTLPSGITQKGTLESSPYLGFYGYYVYNNTTNRFPYFRGSNRSDDLTKITAKDDSDINGKINGITDHRARTGDTGYEYRWLLMKEPYTIYNLVVTDGTNPVNDVWVTYSNPSDVGITRLEQQHGGFFAVSNDVTPSSSMFSCPQFPDATITIMGTTITVTLVMDPDNLVDKGVYSIYCAYDNGNYPIYDNNGSPKISAYSDGRYAPQFFAFFQDGTNDKGTPKYRLKCASGDDYGKNFYYTGATTYSFNAADTDNWFVFVNNSSNTKNQYTWETGDGEDSPYTSFFQCYGASANTYRTIVGKWNASFNGYSNKFYSDYRCERTSSANGNDFNSRWLLKKEPYTVYRLVVQDAGGTPIDGVAINYSNPEDVDITRLAQPNGGFFVIKNDVTPTADMFSLESVVEYELMSTSFTGTTITVTVAPKVTSNVVVGRYYIKNRGRNKWLRQESDAISGTDARGTTGYVWDVVASGTANQYYLRNESTDNTAYTLVENKSEATPVIISSAEISQTGRDLGCVGIKAADGNEDWRFFNMQNYSPWSVVRYTAGSDAASEWFFYCSDTEEGTEFLIQCKNSTKFAARGADDDAQLVQIAKGNVDGTNSIWTLMASGMGYEMGNGGTSNKLATVTASGTFTAAGVLWYIQKDATDNTYYNISTTPDFSGDTSWNNAGGQGNNVGYWHPGSGEPGSCWRFVTIDQYYWDAMDYIKEIYDAEHKNDLFYLKESAYNTLIAAAHGTKAEKIAAANDIYNALNDYSNINMPEDGKDYLIKNYSGYYMNTIDEGAKLNLKTTDYNSSFFWHVTKTDPGQYHISQSCYGTTGGEFPSADKRYINNVAGMADNNTVWTYVSAPPSSALTLAAYVGEGYTEVLAGNGHMHGRYDLPNSVLTWNDRSSNNNRWAFIPVEEASAPLIAAAETAIANANTGAFSLTEEVVDDIQDAIDALEADYNYVNYYILEQLLNANSSYYWLETGRYLVRNYEFDPDGDGNVNDTETYLTSLINPEGVVEDAVGYWSIWDITNLGYGQYMVVNEGNKYILAPGRQLDGDPNTDERNNGFLFYDTSASAFQVGDPEVGDESTLLFYPASAVSAGLPTSESVSGNFAAITVTSQVNQGKYMNMYTASDHVASYSTSPTDRKGCFWQFIPINAANETNHEGTHSGEAEMFANQVNGLAGYVGGVVTLDNVSSVPCLDDIVKLRDAAVAALSNGTALNYTNAPYEAVTVNLDDNVGAKAYRAILDRIHDIKDGKEPNGSTNNDLKKYYQDLRPTEVINEANVYHPFFLENMSGQRPEFGGRLSQTSETGYWKCIRQVEANDNLSVFYVRRNGVVGDNATYWLRNGEKTGVGNFLKHGTNTYNEEVGYVAHNAEDSNGDGIPNEALEFKIDPVIPGVWQMRDVSDGNETGGSRYLTITGLGPTVPGHNYTIQYYDKSETSTLWKFKTFNDLDKIYLRQGTTTEGMSFFCTFSYPLNIVVPKDGNPTPYYCSAAYRSRGGTNAALKVVFEAVPDDGTNYYLKGNEGYMFMAASTEGLNVVNDASDPHNGYIYIDDAQFLSGSIPLSLPQNSMMANLNTTYVTSENWARIYALGNVSTTTQVGSYHGTPVYGIGMGFYHVKIGGKLNPNTAYIPRDRFSPADDEDLPSYSIKEMSESGIPAEIVFKDEFGNIVDQIEVLPDGTMQRTADGPVYDLAGRRVSKPTHGIYIQNGRKVMYK